MKTISFSVAQAKKKFSEVINRSVCSDCRVIITKRDKPVAAVVSLSDLHTLEQNDRRGGLLSVTGKWQDFDELEDNISESVKERRSEGAGRNVSL